jgi:hypothetical protein
MGTNVSKEVTNIVNQTITDQSTEVINSTVLNRQINLNASQDLDFDLKVGGSIRNCNLQFKQDMKITSDIYDSIDSNTELDLSRKIEETLDNTAKTNVTQAVSGVNFGSTNISTVNKNISNYSFHDLSTTVSNRISSNINNAIDASQKQKIKVDIGGDYICEPGSDGGVDIGQNVDIAVIIDSTLKEEKVAKMVNDFVLTATNTSETITDQLAKGIDPFAIFGIILGILFLGLVIFGCVYYFGTKKIKGAIMGVFRKKPKTPAFGSRSWFGIKRKSGRV